MLSFIWFIVVVFSYEDKNLILWKWDVASDTTNLKCIVWLKSLLENKGVCK